ncbi:terminase small subunit [Paenibacillus sp. FSL R10-2734]|uniref:terminase small subunit n=1 Tax=Paenibacillus sp. FSL R10-2734 TaxID=2954691 RepID=UPI0030DCBBC7
MPRARDPNRDRALEIWREHGGEITNRQIAEQLDIDEKKVAVWKQRDKWNVVQQSTNKVVQQPKEKKSVVQQKKPKSNKQKKEVARGDPSEVEDELTDKQRMFVLEYMRDFNATRAAMAAGYSKRAAYAIGWENLRKPEIQAEITRLKKQMTAELGLSVHRVIAEYLKIAFADTTDYVDFGTTEEPVIGIDGPTYDEEGDPVTKTVSFVHFKSAYEVDGTLISEVKQGRDGVSIKFYDKMRALKELEKYLGYMDEETKLRVQKLQLEIKGMTPPDANDLPDDGFMEALKGHAREVWADEGEA